MILSCSEGDKLVPTVQKNMNELAVSLLHLQQNIAIPEISLTVHPIIAAAIKKAQSEDRRPMVEDVEQIRKARDAAGDQQPESSFLNSLHKIVSSWIREIRRVGFCLELIALRIFLAILVCRSKQLLRVCCSLPLLGDLHAA